MIILVVSGQRNVPLEQIMLHLLRFNALVVGSKGRVVPLHLCLVHAVLVGHAVHYAYNVETVVSLQGHGEGQVVFAGQIRKPFTNNQSLSLD